ncbi:nucleotidyltransferase [Streptomyces violarus]|uniref:Streptomycin 3'-adenylyltransferase n=1 Tax=Streptomyces violarus TaxID=67380 RepID=A0A7W4ZWP3_9ACTN|nr:MULTISPECIES: aminoglycoside adenylyltransferase family protein [Streptomyces]MBB3079990.1 streptomycin 3'-adenylyltransferase [Streptomyces violarus]WRU00453.1 aminoglycoside adenylyltransferase family protein [Streptomyces sp. CGMCC 4.1772]GHD13616.1 nucleotidyltransferase [Streptomyces violarus]
MPEQPGTDHLVQLLHRTLPDTLLGIYLHGSATLGGLRPHSDIDVLAVVRESMTHAQRRELVEELLTVSGVEGRRHVELIVVVRDDVRPWRYPPTCDFLYGDWLREEFECGVIPSPETSPDLAPLLTMVLRAAAPLHGPPPADLLDPVPHADLRRAVVAGVPELMDELDSDTRNVLLTLARIWTTLTTGDIRSKDAAATWALGRLPAEHRPVLARARAVYLGEEDECWDGLAPRACAEFLVREITESYAS